MYKIFFSCHRRLVAGLLSHNSGKHLPDIMKESPTTLKNYDHHEPGAYQAVSL